VSVQVGRIAALGPKRVPSAFVKQPVADPVPVEIALARYQSQNF